MNRHRSLKTLLLIAAIAVVLGAPSAARADESCCFNNNFQSVGKYYCDNTMIRGGWSLGDCGNPAQLPSQNLTPEPGFVQPTEPVQQRQYNVQPVQPGTAAGAQDASLLQVSAPLNVRFAAGVDSANQGAGQTITGILEDDLMSGDTVIAPAGSEVHFRIVPTSYWTDGGGDAFEIQATAIKVGDKLMPVNATAVSATTEIDTSGTEVNVPKGSLVSFETQVADQHAADKNALEAGAAAWMEAFSAKDIDAITAFYAEDAVLLPPNAPAIFGRDAVRATIQEMFAAGLAIELEDLEIKVEGDLGYKAGRYRTRGEDGSLIDRGKFIEIWSKVDGNWVLHRDIWNSSVQPSVEDEAEE